jgi:Icc-related predicted phosphoesterase
MKFLVLTDLHQKASAIERLNGLAEKYNVRAILYLGDITDFGSCEDAVDMLKRFKSEIYFIAGNADPPETPQYVKKLVHNVDGESFEIDGIRFAALGGSNPTPGSTPNELSEEEIMRRLTPICSKGMVLMTHAPSYGHMDTIPSGLHVGSKSIRAIVDEYRPIVAMSGHVHEAFGSENCNGTLFFNPGPAREGRAALLTIDNGKANVRLFGPHDE